MRPIEQPTVVTGDGPGADRTVTTHPAFGQIGASRVSGSAALYDSDFQHNAFITITIRRSQLTRDLSRDWHFGREELIEVAMTEAQWATFVSSPNIGSGVPCTLRHLNGEVVPGLPEPEARAAQFGTEVRETLQDAIRQLRSILGDIEGAGISKAKAAPLREKVEKAIQELSANLPFVAKQFEEHAEATVEKAKAEVHGYVTGVLMRTGLDAIGAPSPLLLEERGSD